MANQFRNVYQSFIKRVVSEVDATENVVYQGLDTSTAALSDWIVCQVPVKIPRTSRKGIRNEVWTFQVDCYAHVDKSFGTVVAIDQHIQMADQVDTAFSQVDYAIQDWQNSPSFPTLGWIRGKEVEQVPIPSGEANLLRMMCQWDADYIIE